MKGEKFNIEDKTREYIKDEILERVKIKKLERKKRGEADLVYKESSRKGAHAKPSEPPNSTEQHNRNLKIEDLIFKCWERGNQIEWERLQKKSEVATKYKDHEDIDYYSHEFVNHCIRAQELFEAFERIITLKYVFRNSNKFLMTIKWHAGRKAMSDPLKRQLKQLQFRNKKMLTGRHKFIEINSQIRDILKRVGLLRLQLARFHEGEAKRSHKLFQFFRSVKTLGAREVVRLKFEGMCLSKVYAMHLVQKGY